MCDQVEICVRIEMHVWVCAFVLLLFVYIQYVCDGMFGVCAGVPVSSRVSTKIQQLLNTLKRPKRPPLSEFFVDDSEEIVEGERQ